MTTLLDAIAGTILRNGRALETVLDAGDCERIAKSVLEAQPTITLPEIETRMANLEPEERDDWPYQAIRQLQAELNARSEKKWRK